MLFAQATILIASRRSLYPCRASENEDSLNGPAVLGSEVVHLGGFDLA